MKGDLSGLIDSKIYQLGASRFDLVVEWEFFADIENISVATNNSVKEMMSLSLVQWCWMDGEEGKQLKRTK